ncbi:MAG: hypothetical protein U0T73_13495 [Chitinophagales bacterium]
METAIDTTVHRKLAVDCFNAVWQILGKENATADEINEAILLAHSSTWHWKFAGNELHQQRGEWIISRVYAHFGFGEMALYHAKRCLELTEKHGFKDFDLGYAYEAMARAYMVLKNADAGKPYYEKAIAAGELIEDAEDKSWFSKDMATISF